MTRPVTGTEVVSPWRNDRKRAQGCRGQKTYVPGLIRRIRAGSGDFVSVALRLGADESKQRFEAKLKMIAKVGAPKMIRRRDENLPQRAALREADRKARSLVGKLKKNEPEDRPQRSLLQSPSGKMDGSPPRGINRGAALALSHKGKKRRKS